MNLYTFTNFILSFKFNQIKLFLLFFSFSLTLNSQSTSRDNFFIKSSEQFYSSKYSKNGAQRIDMYKDLIKNKNVGLVVNQTSVINVLNSDNNLLQSIGLEGRKNVLTKFDVEKMCKATLAEYRKILI